MAKLDRDVWAEPLGPPDRLMVTVVWRPADAPPVCRHFFGSRVHGHGRNLHLDDTYLATLEADGIRGRLSNQYDPLQREFSVWWVTPAGRPKPTTVWSGDPNASAACVACGAEVWHINDPAGFGSAWAASQRLRAGPPGARGVRTVSRLYCNNPACGKDVWECPGCSVDVVGPGCPFCRRKRAAPGKEVARG